MISPELQKYCEQHTSPPSEILKYIERQTHLHMLMPHMISGHLQGQFLAFVSAMLKPKLVLEIGTFTGYATICLAEGLSPEGKIVTIEKNEELQPKLLTYFSKANLQHKIDLRIGLAAEIIPTLPYTFDLVFIDADKKNNALYYDLVWEKVALGGFILIDNVLWHGKVIEQKKDTETQAIHDLNQKIQQDQRVKNLLLPLRDGLMLVQKIRP
ncbi:MAG: O-methyltransferase [Microscillaceae bacterium]|nr:O-methyltransferase [Microscillaceae bacterium]MDW8459612.1 O-methyltransferase [Cytophagales bacterium]